MEQQELYKLRTAGLQRFDDVSGLRSCLENLFGEESVLPTIIGYKDHPQAWNIQEFSPLTTSDELTVKSYQEALKELEEIQHSNFWGSISYMGIDSKHYSNHGQSILIVEAKSRNNQESFYLDCRFNSKGPAESKILGYEASSRISETHLRQTCSRFVGPNISKG
jgi:hypothetical protein